MEALKYEYRAAGSYNGAAGSQELGHGRCILQRQSLVS